MKKVKPRESFCKERSWSLFICMVAKLAGRRRRIDLALLVGVLLTAFPTDLTIIGPSWKILEALSLARLFVQSGQGSWPLIHAATAFGKGRAQLTFAATAVLDAGSIIVRIFGLFFSFGCAGVCAYAKINVVVQMVILLLQDNGNEATVVGTASLVATTQAKLGEATTQGSTKWSGRSFLNGSRFGLEESQASSCFGVVIIHDKDRVGLSFLVCHHHHHRHLGI